MKRQLLKSQFLAQLKLKTTYCFGLFSRQDAENRSEVASVTINSGLALIPQRL